MATLATARARQAALVGAIAVLAAGACETRDPDRVSSMATPTPPNRAPKVVLSPVTSGSCAPLRPPALFVACSLELQASATDPDGDPVTYSWASESAVPARGRCVVPFRAPTQTRVLCQLYSPEQTITSTVTVSDGRGLSASASLTVFGEGVNQPPSIDIGATPTMLPNSPTMVFFAGVWDQEEGVLCGGWQFTHVSVTGDCEQKHWLDASCLSGVELHLYRTAPAGMCHLSLTVQDSAGATTSKTLAISYPPR